MALHRFPCPTCGRPIALTARGLLYRHDPAGGRTPDLRSCPGSLKVVRPPAAQPVLFAYVPPELAAAVEPEDGVEAPGLFGVAEVA